MSTEAHPVRMYSDGLKAYPRAAAYLLAWYDVVFHIRELVNPARGNHSNTIEKANGDVKKYAARRHRADGLAMEREAMWLDFYRQWGSAPNIYHRRIWIALLHELVKISGPGKTGV